MSLKNDPKVQELVAKERDKAAGATKKALIGQVKTFLADAADQHEDNAVKKALKTIGKDLVTSLKA